ncbi:bifunctional 5,10-methylenetetrahydrofolate dehydrogenase/5,10-methenyltetrahydrofolate cyclohydrolase [Acetobacterium carbinolicum]|jgi:methylenetetrahydrofolate dehydrogenase (NADP+)/methenyltetrahydrofolate cyclohydrolase|uniref:bifunctional 5,10-methylenetetrahydrofolate dehydrogenase/5,10-methenyltetrahydrofolate cyclohydrolase n=1 Tax=Acetobacterium TaxID=33951 RepID=UPI000DBEC239|nr:MULTISPECIES: tetrahydrofolate dehydrogenase/cyclohydrolase catalytic domain-containing protein [unclassified Acetobacterium]AWW27937.1 bifunctional 5,10-methylenetetrahydrofolate dehydrogenase/5,10-methenyltetrahydrofolate cyclohydrolase [Acetobacterium sp. KB-1]MDZ5726728.1 tetrahydrofolate dehydrogenase/cyclohydrolase catalytic domain-containing protein [Acetobacterium sp. K1/6]
MAAKLLSGKEVSESVLAQVLKDANELKGKGIQVKMAIMRVGEDAGSISYEKSIITRMGKSNIEVESVQFPIDVTEADFIAKLEAINADKNIHSVLIFQPLPDQIDADKIKYMLSPEKDPDALNPTNLGKLMIADERGFFPCTAEGVMEMFKFYNIDVKGKDVVVINNSNVLGKPLTIMLTNEFATVTMCHVHTKDTASFTKKADIVVTACGIYGLVKPEMLSEDCILIDVAMSQMKDENKEFVLNAEGKKIRAGDAHVDCLDKVAMITSATPGCGGGTGPITTALLAAHVIKACKMQSGLL